MAWHNCFQKYPPLNFLHYVKPQSSPGKEPAPVKECSYQFIPPVLKSVTIPSISSYNLLNNDTPNLKVEQSPLQIKSAPRTHKNDTSCEQKYGKAFIQLGNPKPWLRTPVACVFCRRRKIKCSGFEHNSEGRCFNCQRFEQQCIFVPVSSQPQAFVPAHAVYPDMRNMLFDSDGRLLPMTHSNQLFGAHGQPLGTTQLQIAPPDNHPASSPASSPNSNTEYPTQVTGRKRARQDPHPFILPPPIPSEAGHQRAILRRRPPIEYDLKPTETTAIRSAGEGSGLSPDSVGCTISILQPLSQPAPRRRATLPRSSSSNRSNPMSLDNIVGRVPNVGINETCSDNI